MPPGAPGASFQVRDARPPRRAPNGASLDPIVDVHLDDPAARQRRMWWARAGGLALAIFALFLPLAHRAPLLATFANVLGILGFEAFFLAPLAQRLRTGSQAGTLALEPGKVVVTTARGRNVLRGKDLYGATTAREPGTGRIVLTLSLGALRAYPVSLTFAGVDDMESVRRALGVGQLGRGMVWISGGRPNAARGFFRGILLGFAALAPFFVGAGGLGCTLLFLAALVGLLGEAWNGETFKLWGDRIVVGAGPGRDEWAYADVSQVAEDRDGLVLQGMRGGGFARIAVPSAGWLAPFSAHERALLVAQVHAALARSRTAPPMLSGAAAGEALTNLKRRSSLGERPSGWLSRLDAFAAVSEASRGGAGYREASLDIDALWSTLEDPDADLELRCAAARILHRRTTAPARTQDTRAPDDKLRIRIATAVESAADEPARVRLRLMTEDHPPESELEEVFEPKPTLAERLV